MASYRVVDGERVLIHRTEKSKSTAGSPAPNPEPQPDEVDENAVESQSDIRED